MTRHEQRLANQRAISRAVELIETKVSNSWRQAPSYKAVAGALTLEGYRTSRGNLWTPKRLFRMLQREGISGLHGLKCYGWQVSSS